MEARTLNVTINRPVEVVYDFASNPANLPKWAKAFCLSIKLEGQVWRAETPQGPVTIRFAEKNSSGILDHYVTVAPGMEAYVPMRVVANGQGSEVIFTLFRMPDMTDEVFAQNVKWVESDLAGLKNVMEKTAAGKR